MIFTFQNRFIIQKADDDNNQHLLFLDYLSPRSAITSSVADFSIDSVQARQAALRLLIPHCIVPAPFPVRMQPESKTDTHFWQFPAITERLAFLRHAAIKPPEWCLQDATRINTYLGLPWATYIDKEWLSIPALVKQIISVRLRGYQALAEAWGLQWRRDVAVHTVCQHIYWVKLLPLWQDLGITDVHIAHCEPASEALAAPFGIRVHAWSLVAPNIVDPDRQAGLLLGKPVAERAYLATFKGAHMSSCYRSEVRLRLREEALKVAYADVVFELTDDWHFNPMVYQEQVTGEPLTPEQIAAERTATARYNVLLSDSVFSLCPEGSGPNTLRLWESLAVGAIPVVIVEDWIPPTVPGTGLAWEDAVIWVRRDEVPGLFDRLRTLRDTEPQRLEAMQTAGMALYQRFADCLCF